jgi:hypothetical protein
VSLKFNSQTNKSVFIIGGMEFDADADLSIDEQLTFDVPSESSIRRYGACLECQLRHIKCKQLVLYRRNY